MTIKRDRRNFYYSGEAFAALEAIQQSGLPEVVTISPMGENTKCATIGILWTLAQN